MMMMMLHLDSVKAQQISFPSHHLLYFSYTKPLSVNQSIELPYNYSLLNQPSKISSGSINDLPFFCALECKVRKHTNIWIKLRAGDDASYMRMITPSSK